MNQVPNVAPYMHLWSMGTNNHLILILYSRSKKGKFLYSNN